MTKRDFEKLKRKISGPFDPDLNRDTGASPSRDSREDFICTIPNDETIDVDFQLDVKSLKNLIKHFGSAKFSIESTDEKRMKFFKLRDHHDTLLSNVIINYHGSELYRKAAKIIESYGLWDKEWHSLNETRSQGHLNSLGNLVKHVATPKFLEKSVADQKNIYFQLRNLHEILTYKSRMPGYYSSELSLKVSKMIETYRVWEGEWCAARNIRIK